MSDDGSLAAALRYAERGWKIFPVPWGTKKSHKSAEHSGGVKWGMTSDPAEIRRDFKRWPKAGVGLPTGVENGFFVVEADTPKGHKIDGLAGLKALEDEHGPLPGTLMAESPSGSLHRYYKLPGAIRIRNSASEIAPGVDVRGDGGMVVAPPTRRADGAYRWLNSLPIADAPAWLIELAEAKPRNPGANKPEREVDLDTLEAALEVIPNDPSVDWVNWNTLGMALWRATTGSAWGGELFDRWSQKHESYDADVTADRWDGFERSPPNKIGAGSIFYWADRAAPGWRLRYEQEKIAAVKKAAAELKAGDIDGAEAVFDQLVRIRNRTQATDDIIVDMVKTALGKAVKIESVRALLKEAEIRLDKLLNPDNDKNGGPPHGFREIDGWMRQQCGSKWVTISSPLTVTAMLRDGASSSWGLAVHFEDADGRAHDVPVPAEVYGDPNVLATLLMSEGLRLADAAPKTRVALSTLLMKWSHPHRRTIATVPGWTHDLKAFLLGDGRAIGDSSVVLAHGRRADAKGPGARGGLAAWTASVAALCAGNPILLMSVSTAFAAPLLEVLNVESGLVHFRGDSSQGKTTVLRTAASVWGSPAEAIRTWRATTNGLEGVAAMHNSILLVLDELHQIAAKEAGAAALMLCNEAGKTRANQHGETRAVRRWKFLVLSSGECSLADRAAAAGEGVTAGQEVRFLDLKADDRASGCFDDLHGEADGKAFVIRLAAAFAQAYGTAGPAFVEFIMRTPDIVSRAEAVMAKFETNADAAYGLAGADAQVTRALRRFAVIAAGGELATQAGITGWAAGEAADAIQEVFGLWIGGRGGLMSAADRNAVANTRAFLIKNDSRFHKLVPDNDGGLMLSTSMLDRPIHNLAGWKDTDGYWVSSDVWRREIHAGSDGKSAARVLRDAELLVLDKNRGSRLTRRGPRAIDRIQCYYVKKAVLATEQGV